MAKLEKSIGFGVLAPYLETLNASFANPDLEGTSVTREPHGPEFQVGIYCYLYWEQRQKF